MTSLNTTVFFDEISRVTDFSLDFFVVCALVALAFSYGLYRGAGRLVSVLFSLYATILLFIVFPYWNIFSGTADARQIFGAKVAIFFAVSLCIHILLKRALDDLASSGGLYQWLQTMALSVTLVGVLLAFFGHFLSLKDFYAITPPLDSVFEMLFVSLSAFFWWVIVSLFFVFLATRR